MSRPPHRLRYISIPYDIDIGRPVFTIKMEIFKVEKKEEY